MIRTAAAIVPAPKTLLADPLMHKAVDRSAREAITAIAQGAPVLWDTLRHVQTIDADDLPADLPPEWRVPGLVLLRFTADIDVADTPNRLTALRN